MQYTIPFHESLMPSQIADAFQHMMVKLPDYLQIFGGDILSIARGSIETVRDQMEILRTYCDNNPFENEALEISFFKNVKPQFHAHLILWMAIYDLELDKPVGGSKSQVKLIKKRMSALRDFYSRHIDFYHYYRSGQTDRDRFYFVRNTTNHKSLTDPQGINANLRFSSSHDYLVAAILGNDMIEKYLEKALQYGRRPNFRDEHPIMSTKLQWTASKTGLVELIYALQTGGVFNDGRAMVHEIASLFQEQFDVKLVNYYHTFNELRSRKKNRTAFLQSLRDTLAQKMDSLEEN